MCGISGIIAADPEVARRAVRAMNDVQQHRGPDDSGEAFFRVGDRTLGLGFRRLAIIDLSPAGHQPMLNPDTGDALVFNGEIYSFTTTFVRRELGQQGVRFRGRSDTEVLLRALERWGAKAFERLDGMFAFAYYGASDATLTIARDPAGIKPLYVAQTPDAFLFASETRALIATGLVDTSLDDAGLAGFLAYGSVQEPLTLFRGVRSLEPGRFMTLDVRRPSHSQSRRYWNFPPTRSAPPSELITEIRETFQETVAGHLVSDRPVGVFLSAGIDSTVIAGLATRAAGAVNTFTVCVEPEGEGAQARRTAELLGTRHHEVVLGESDVVAWARRWLEQMDQPSIDGLNTYIVSRAARSEGIVVALSGLGGDELFGGYPSFRDVPRLRARLRTAAWLPRPLKRAAAWVSASGRSAVVRQKALDMAETQGELTRVYLHRRRLLSNRFMKALGFETPPAGLDIDYQNLVPSRLGDDEVAAVRRLEFETYMRNTLLRDSDGASMLTSLELRVPMLTRPVLDLLFSIPGSVLLPAGAPGKVLERQVFVDLLRPEILNQQKRGFTLPIARWILGPLKEQSKNALEVLRRSGVLKADGLQAIWKTFEREPDSPSWSRAWALVVLGEFLKRR